MWKSGICICVQFYLTLKMADGLKYINPVSYNENEGPILYDQVGVIIYRFYSPQRHLDNMLVTGSTCSSATIPDAGYCPLISHLQRASEKLKPLITASTDFQASKQELKKVVCGGPITTYFTAEYSSSELVDDYISQLVSCGAENQAGLVIHGTNFDYAQPFDAYYTAAHTGYDTVYYSGSDEAKEIKASHAIALAAINTAGQIHYLAEAIQWKEAAADCRNRLIPRSIITEQMFKSSLQQLFSNLTEHTLVIPNVDSAISTYFSSSFVDCTFSGEELVIAISIPLRRKQSNIKLVTLAAIPFLHTFQHKISLCFVDNFQDDKNFLYDRLTKEFSDAKDCSAENPHCHFQRANIQFKTFRKTCEYAIFKGLPNQEVAKYCQLDCHDETDFSLPIIYKKFDKIYIVGVNNDSFHITCPRKETTTLTTSGEGALEIDLPCGCNIIYKNNEFFSNRQPCSKFLAVEHVLPIHFIQYKSSLYSTH